MLKLKAPKGKVVSNGARAAWAEPSANSRHPKPGRWQKPLRHEPAACPETHLGNRDVANQRPSCVIRPPSTVTAGNGLIPPLCRLPPIITAAMRHSHRLSRMDHQDFSPSGVPKVRVQEVSGVQKNVDGLDSRGLGSEGFNCKIVFSAKRDRKVSRVDGKKIWVLKPDDRHRKEG